MLAQSAAQTYQKNSVTTAGPLKQILMVYDKAILGYRQQNLEVAGRAIRELIHGLDMDASPISAKLLAIYQYCGELARKRQYNQAVSILQDLRDTWAAMGSNG